MLPRPIEVALVEDDAGMRERLSCAIHASHDLRLLRSAASAREILDWLRDHPVNVLLVDIGLPDLCGINVVRAALQMHPACQVMVITMFGDESNMMQAFEAGAQGYLLKDGTEDELARHVRSLHAGGSPMSPVIARRLLQRMPLSQARPPDQSTPIVDEILSNREREVLDRVARGFTYQEVAHQLGISITTVQTHIRNIYAKLAVHSKTEAVFEARQLGLLR